MDETQVEFLPPDMLRKCFSFVPTPLKIHSVSVVNRSWREVSNMSEWYIEEQHMRLTDSFIWEKDWEIERLTIDTSNFIEKYFVELTKTSAVKNLRLNFEVGNRLWDVLSEMSISSSLESINCIDFTPSDSLQLGGLQSLNAFAIPKVENWNSIPKTLKSLTLSHITNSSAISHLQRLTNLTDLSLASCDELTQPGFVAISKISSGLLSADFSNTSIDAFSLDKILHTATGLQKLSIRDCQKLKDRDDVVGAIKPSEKSNSNPMANLFAELKAVTKKVQTHVPAAYRDTENGDEVVASQEEEGGFLSIGVGKCLVQRKLLTELQVSGVGFLDDFGVRLILKELRHLEIFRMTKNRDITDAGFELDGISLPPNLHTISIGNCVQLTDSTLGVISKQDCLQSLNISGCTSVTEEGVLEITRNCIKLKKLYAFMVSLQSAAGNGLSRPSFTSDSIITDRVLQSLWKLPDFEHFCTAWQPRITAAGFPENEYRSLKTFQADFCSFDDAAYHKIVTSFPLLNTLSIGSSVKPESGMTPVSTECLLTLASKDIVPGYISLQTASPVPLTKLISNGRIRHLDLEFFGTKSSFPEKEWLELLISANKCLTPVFLGKYAQKLINVDAFVRFAPITAKSRLQSSVVGT